MDEPDRIKNRQVLHNRLAGDRQLLCQRGCRGESMQRKPLEKVTSGRVGEGAEHVLDRSHGTGRSGDSSRPSA